MGLVNDLCKAANRLHFHVPATLYHFRSCTLTLKGESFKPIKHVSLRGSRYGSESEIGQQCTLIRNINFCPFKMHFLEAMRLVLNCVHAHHLSQVRTVVKSEKEPV